MAKVKNKRNAGLADKVHKKKKAEISKKKLNPFEVHINREKLKVLGKKSKHDRGLPGVSRAKAFQKRKETLGTEMKLMNKTNAFIDKRIGEKNSQLSSEDRMIARFTAERARQHSKKNIFNLADDEILTHRGQTLEQIEKFDDPRSSDEEDEYGKKFGGLDDEFVAEGHFGGGMLSKVENDGAKSHKDLIEQLIAESKKRKAEKQKEKEQTLDLTEKLDTEWKDLQPVVFKRARLEEKESIIDKLLRENDKKSDDYDKMMRELKFDRRGTPSDALKSDEKQAKEEKLRLEQLEKERMQRMTGDATEAPKVQQAHKHRSADDLDDNFALDDDKEFMLAYDKDGNPLVPEHVLKDYSVPNSKPKFEDGISDTSEEESEHEDDDESEHEDDDESGNESDDESDDSTEDTENKAKSQVKKDGKKKDAVNQIVESVESESDSKGDSQKHNTKSIKSKISYVNIENKSEESHDESDDESNEDSEENVSQSSDVKSKTKDESEGGDDLDDASENVTHLNKKIRSKENLKGKNNLNIPENKKKESIDESEDTEDDVSITKSKYNVNKNITEGKDGHTVEKNSFKNRKSSNKSKETENDKKDYNEDSVLFQNVEKGDKSDGSSNENSDEESSEESDSEEHVESKKDDFQDLKSDQESDEVDMDDDTQLNSLFDLKAKGGENVKDLLLGKTPSQQATTIQKLMQKYDPSLAESNKDKLSIIYAQMLQYVNDIFSDVNNEGELIKSFLIFDKLAPIFYDIAQKNKVSSKKFVTELLKEKHNAFIKNPRKVPDLSTLIFFKLVSLIYPTSDFRHPVTTPSLIFMSEILARSRFNNAYSISRGLFITSLVLEYTVLSKRLVPTAINFLRGILYLAANTSVLNPIQVVPPFKLHRDAKLLNLEEDCSTMEIGNKMTTKNFVLDSIDNDFKIRCLLVSTLQLKEFFNHFNDIEAQQCLFEPHLQLFGRIDLELYPKKVAKCINEIVKYMKESLEMKTFTPLCPEKKKPKALRLYEPDIQEVFTGRKNAKLPREKAERARLQTKIKKEMKGALREIRRDKAYIASVKIRQKIQSDNIRKEKVKQIYKEAAVQQGELNKLKRMK